MARLQLNRSGEMEVFVRAVDLGGFSAAARAVGMTPSAVSKLISRLESRLGARLLNRSTRQLLLTPEGCLFYERARDILEDIKAAETAAGLGERAEGVVRISTSASYLIHVLAPVLPEFLARYPRIRLDILQTDSVIDLLAERVDVAVRAGPLKSSSLIARKLGETGMILVAAPAYLSRIGVPGSQVDLASHDILGLGYRRAGDPPDPGAAEPFAPQTGRVQVSEGEGLRQLALAGVGLARLAAFTVRNDIAEGRLVPVLRGLHAAPPEAFHAIHTGQVGPMPTRVRTVLDFLAQNARVT
ncbi:LysR family transcriptional regulator [Frigidibacter oleivorans]|uniref:LysR family transcriptional regulator n=1 Tax=Frigidibacter oleivorans TaxID=2487129 RepID=UPI000F8F3E73|nr:LysR family transcriptional regulator [Frigidibacter oleivorans]